MACERFERLDADSPRTEFRFDCCPSPAPVVTADSDDPKAWEVECENCSMTLCYLTAPDDSATWIEMVTCAHHLPPGVPHPRTDECGHCWTHSGRDGTST